MIYTVLIHLVYLQDYGDVPQYLKKRQQEIARAQEEYNDYIAESFKRGKVNVNSVMRRNYLHSHSCGS